MLIEYTKNELLIEGTKLPDWLKIHYDETTFSLYFSGTPLKEHIG